MATHTRINVDVAKCIAALAALVTACAMAWLLVTRGLPQHVNINLPGVRIENVPSAQPQTESTSPRGPPKLRTRTATTPGRASA